LVSTVELLRVGGVGVGTAVEPVATPLGGLTLVHGVRASHQGRTLAPHRAEERDDGPVTVPVAIVTSRSEAELMVGFLQSNGLWAVVSADDAGGQEPQLQLQGVRVLVARADEDSARRLLAAAEDGTGPDGGG
jgi:hypothetical protein